MHFMHAAQIIFLLNIYMLIIKFTFYSLITFNKLFKNCVADFANELKNKLIKKKIFLIIERTEKLQSNRKYLQNL